MDAPCSSYSDFVIHRLLDNCNDVIWAAPRHIAYCLLGKECTLTSAGFEDDKRQLISFYKINQLKFSKTALYRLWLMLYQRWQYVTVRSESERTLE